jgi:DNA-binding NarL/FixJ family response regulator
VNKARYTNWWYNVVLSLIKECARGRHSSPQLQNIEKAMEKAVKATAVYDNWEYRNKAIYLIFYKGYSTLKVANELHFSEVTIKRWKSEFVNKVGYFAGF